MNNPGRPRTGKELEDRAKALGILVNFDGCKWIAIKGGEIVTREKDRRMALACTVARVESAIGKDGANEDETDCS